MVFCVPEFFDEFSFPLAVGFPGASALASEGGGVVDFGFSNPFIDVDFSPLLANPASTALDGQVLMSITTLTLDTIQLTFDSLLAIVPNSGQINGSVDYAGLGTLTFNGAEARIIHKTI